MKTAVALLFTTESDDTPRMNCSGTVLSSTLVITAGHCVEHVKNNPEFITVVAGEGDLRSYLKGQANIAEVFTVTKVSVHPKYSFVDGVELIWDMAILHTTTEMPIGTNPNIAAAVLPPPGLKYKGKEVRIGGWGKTNSQSGGSPVHLALDMKLNSDEECLEAHPQYRSGKMICIGHRKKTTCGGDSGSGAILRGWNKPIILGVLSFGNQACRTPGVYQKLEKSLPWIFKETKLRYGIRFI